MERLLQRYASLKNWKKGLLFLNLVLDSMGWSMILPALPAIHHKLHLNNTDIGYLTSAISVVVFLSGAVQGKLVEYAGSVPMLRLSACAQIAGHLLMLLALYRQSFFVFVLARFSPALFKSGMVVSQAILYDLTAGGSPDESLRDFGTLFACSNLAYIVGPVLGGLLYTFSETAPFYFGIFTSCCGLVVMWLIEQTGYRGPSGAQQQPAISAKSELCNPEDIKPTSKFSLNHMLHLKFSYQIGNTLFEALFAQHCRNMMALSSASIGYLLGYCGTLSAISNLYILRHLIKRGNTDALLPMLTVSLGLGLCIWSVCTSLFWLVLAISVVTVASNLFLSILQNQIAHSQNHNLPNTTTTMDDSVLLDASRSKEERDEFYDVESSVSTLTLRKHPHRDHHLETDDHAERSKNDIHKTTFDLSTIVGQWFKGGGQSGKKSAGVVFGLSSTADRAARIVSPLLGTMFLEQFGPIGLAYMSVLVTLYCLVLLYDGSVLQLVSQAPIMVGVSPKSALHSFSFSPKNTPNKKKQW